MNRKSLALKLDLPLHAVHQVTNRLGWSAPRMRVLLFHGIDPEHMDDFARHLEILSRSWTRKIKFGKHILVQCTQNRFRSSPEISRTSTGQKKS